MCIVFYTITHPGYKLILASNRDEYLNRPALPAAWHTFGTDLSGLAAGTAERDAGDAGTQEGWVLSGRDMGSAEGGTWLGVTRDLRIGVITNVRRPRSAPLAPLPRPSRGGLLKAFLSPYPNPGLPSVDGYLRSQLPFVDEYDGFNLLLFHLHAPGHGSGTSTAGTTEWGETEVGYLSNRPLPIHSNLHIPNTVPRLSQGDREGLGKAFGLSNSPLSEPWPKVVEGEKRMAESLGYWAANGEDEGRLIERMFGLLQQSIPLESLADAMSCTCIPPLRLGPNVETPIEESSKGRWYGTRLSTVILVRDDREVTFVERDVAWLDSEGEVKQGGVERRFTFTAVQ